MARTQTVEFAATPAPIVSDRRLSAIYRDPDDSEDEESSDSEFSDSGADKLFVDKDEVWPEEVSSPEEQLDRDAILEAFAQSQRINEDD